MTVSRIAWVNPCFLDYRVPVYAELDRRCGGGLSVIFSADRTPSRVRSKLEAALGGRAVGLIGERGCTIGNKKSDFANSLLKLPYQPGLLRAIRNACPDVVIGEGFFQWTPAVLWSRIWRKVPLVIAYERTAHTERNAGWARTLYRKIVYRWVDAICGNGSLCKEYCSQALGFSPDRVITGAMAADTINLQTKMAGLNAAEVQSLQAELGLVSPVFLYVGRLIELKGLMNLLHGWKRHTETYGALAGTLLLVGDGPQRADLKSFCREIALTNVRFAGAIEYDSIAPYYAMADVFVMPTLEDNWSLVIPEAMACGLPILCSIYNGCWPELVTNDNGKTFDPLEPLEAARKLGWFVEHRDHLKEMGAASARIAGDYSPSKAADAIYRACCLAKERCL